MREGGGSSFRMSCEVENVGNDGVRDRGRDRKCESQARSERCKGRMGLKGAEQ